MHQSLLIIGILAGVLLAEKSLDWWFLAIALIFATLVWAFRKSFCQVSRHLLSFLVQLFATLVGGLVSAVATASIVAVSSCDDPLSKAYYDRKRAGGKRQNATVMCLARRWLNVMFAMVKAGVFYEEKTPAAA